MPKRIGAPSAPSTAQSARRRSVGLCEFTDADDGEGLKRIKPRRRSLGSFFSRGGSSPGGLVASPASHASHEQPVTPSSPPPQPLDPVPVDADYYALLGVSHKVPPGAHCVL
jgi:hypothetical protein